MVTGYPIDVQISGRTSISVGLGPELKDDPTLSSFSAYGLLEVRESLKQGTIGSVSDLRVRRK